MRCSALPLATELRQLRALLPQEATAERGLGGGRELPLRVLCRFRGQSEVEQQKGGREAWNIDEEKISVNESVARWAPIGCEFKFDCTFGPQAQQDDVFCEVEPVVREVLGGVNGSVLCYGQTSAGKTFTMEGAPGDQRGLIPRTLETVFAACEAEGGLGDPLCLRISMLEIYMDRLRDLLNPESTELGIVEDSKSGITVRGLCEIPVSNCEQALDVFRCGQRNRAVASTGMNDQSSRSHSIFILRVDHKDGRRASRKLCLVDLAGNENMKKTCPFGRPFASDIVEEAKAINQSLTTLGLVINRLAECRRPGVVRGTEPHIPYRSSKLTRVLQDSLGGNAFTALVINCSISSLHISETLSTLRFGARARSCVNVVRGAVGEEATSVLSTLRAACREITRLQSVLADGHHLSAADVHVIDAEDIANVSALSMHDEPLSDTEEIPPLAVRGTARAPPWSELSLVKECEPSEHETLCTARSGTKSEPRSARSTIVSVGRHSRKASSAGRLSRHYGRPQSPSSVGEVSPLELSPRSAATSRSRCISRRVSRVSSFIGGGAFSPLDLSPRSIAASRKASLAVPTFFELSPATQRTSWAWPGDGLNLKASEDRVLPSTFHESMKLGALGATPCVFWEDPLTNKEKLRRFVLMQDVRIEELENRLEAVLHNLDKEEQLRERCTSLQAEIDWLSSERMQHLDHALSTTALMEGHSLECEGADTQNGQLISLCSCLYVGNLMRRVLTKPRSETIHSLSTDCTQSYPPDTDGLQAELEAVKLALLAAKEKQESRAIECGILRAEAEAQRKYSAQVEGDLQHVKQQLAQQNEDASNETARLKALLSQQQEQVHEETARFLSEQKELLNEASLHKETSMQETAMSEHAMGMLQASEVRESMVASELVAARDEALVHAQDVSKTLEDVSRSMEEKRAYLEAALELANSENNALQASLEQKSAALQRVHDCTCPTTEISSREVEVHEVDTVSLDHSAQTQRRRRYPPWLFRSVLQILVLAIWSLLEGAFLHGRWEQHHQVVALQSGSAEHELTAAEVYGWQEEPPTCEASAHQVSPGCLHAKHVAMQSQPSEAEHLKENLVHPVDQKISDEGSAVEETGQSSWITHKRAAQLVASAAAIAMGKVVRHGI